MASWQPANSLELDNVLYTSKKENVPKFRRKKNAIMYNSDLLSCMR